MDALIFDFDGVIVDSEPIHFEGFRQVLRTIGVELSREAYYTKYLGYDDHDCFLAAASEQGIGLDEPQLAELIEAKTRIVQRMLGESARALSGAVELIRAARGAGVPLAICSGALRDEIELASRAVGVRECFDVIVPAEDVAKGKPDPEGYLLARQRLTETTGRELSAERCVVVEDSPWGIQAAHAAGMKCLAVASSYPADALNQAECVVASLSDTNLARIEKLL
ncbi:MAG TPA: HAD family hydrolase [Phycisphaerales bacterium]|nr:HAD family hydrolase [Phycisphaerales bacterium]